MKFDGALRFHETIPTVKFFSSSEIYKNPSFSFRTILANYRFAIFLKNLNVNFSRVLHSPFLKRISSQNSQGNHIPILSYVEVITLIRSQFMMTQCVVNHSIPRMTSTLDLFMILRSTMSRGLEMSNSQCQRIQSALTLVPRGEFLNNDFSRGLNLQAQLYHKRCNHNEYDASVVKQYSIYVLSRIYSQTQYLSRGTYQNTQTINAQDVMF